LAPPAMDLPEGMEVHQIAAVLMCTITSNGPSLNHQP
jgi:hypothetical protein